MAELSAKELARIRRSRRSPRITQFDYLHVRRLVADLAVALSTVSGPGDRVLDVWSGSRPYDDLLPDAAEVVSLDVEGNPYGVADVVSNELLPLRVSSPKPPSTVTGRIKTERTSCASNSLRIGAGKPSVFPDTTSPVASESAQDPKPEREKVTLSEDDVRAFFESFR